MALVVDSGIFHWQPLQGTATPPVLVVANTADTPVTVPGLAIASYEVDAVAAPTWVLLAFVPSTQGGAATVLLHNLTKRGYQQIPAVAAAIVPLAMTPAASAPTHLVLAAVAPTAAGEMQVRHGLHTHLSKGPGITSTALVGAGACAHGVLQLIVANVEAYNGAAPYPRRRLRLPALEHPVGQGDRRVHAVRVASQPQHGGTLLALCASEYAHAVHSASFPGADR